MGKRREKTKRSKTVLMFDEEARKEWLLGFSKRKKERQQKAKEDLSNLLKEEQKRRRQEHKEWVKKKQAKYLEKLKDVEEIVEETTKAYNCGGKTVEITEYDFSKQDTMLGLNESPEEEEKNSEAEPTSDHSEEDDSDLRQTHIKLPKKPTRTAMNIEKRLYKLTHKKQEKGRRRRLHDNAGSKSSVESRSGKRTKRKKRNKKPLN